MSVKLILLFMLALTASGGAGLMLSGCGQGETATSPESATKGKTLYTCGMHPQIIQDHPGDCPICGMKLTPIRNTGDAGTAAGANPGAIAIDAVTIQNMNLRTTPVTRTP